MGVVAVVADRQRDLLERAGEVRGLACEGQLRLHVGAVGPVIDHRRGDQVIADVVQRPRARARVRARGQEQAEAQEHAALSQPLEALDAGSDGREAEEPTFVGTRRYVRRQRSWFRRDHRVRWLDGAAGDLLSATVAAWRASQDNYQAHQRTTEADVRKALVTALKAADSIAEHVEKLQARGDSPRLMLIRAAARRIQRIAGRLR